MGLSYDVCVLYKLNEGQSALGWHKRPETEPLHKKIPWKDLPKSSHPFLLSIQQEGRYACLPPKHPYSPNNRANGYTQQTNPSPLQPLSFPLKEL